MTLAEYDAQCIRNIEQRQQRNAWNAVDHYNPFSPHVGGAAHAQRPYDSSDALLGELLREVLHMANAMEAIRGEIADLRAEIRDRAQAKVVAFPGTALRHGTPR